MSRKADDISRDSDPAQVRPRLRHNALWMAAGAGAYAAGQWLILIMLSRFGGPALVGAYGYALAICGPIVVFSYLQLRLLQVADTTVRHSAADYRRVRVLTGALALIVIGAVAAFAAESPTIAFAIVALGLLRVLEGLSDVEYSLLQRAERIDWMATSILLRVALSLPAFAIGLWLSGSLAVAILATIPPWLLVWLVFDRPRARRCSDPGPRPGVPRAPWWTLLSRGLPLGVTATLTSFHFNVPRYVIEVELDLEVLGVFAALAQFVQVGNLLLEATLQSAFPRLARLYGTGERRAFLRFLWQLQGFGLVLGLGGVALSWLLGEWLLELLYGPAFGAEAGLFVWMMGVGVAWFAVAPLGPGLIIQERYRLLPATQALAIMVALAACLLLVPQFGLLGGILGWGAGYIARGGVEMAAVVADTRRFPALD